MRIFQRKVMQNKENNYAFIDSQNLNLAIRDQGWVLDFGRFRQYLKDKYKIKNAYVFIGYVPGNESLYTYFQQSGFIVVFKPTLEIKVNGKTKIKGNVDAELVLHTMIKLKDYDKAMIVSGDGDFHCLVEYLVKEEKLLNIIIPNSKKYSALLRKFRKHFVYVNGLKNKLEYRKNRG
jgi:uncharacterized LabA/DUF88 family protein